MTQQTIHPLAAPTAEVSPLATPHLNADETVVVSQAIGQWNDYGGRLIDAIQPAIEHLIAARIAALDAEYATLQTEAYADVFDQGWIARARRARASLDLGSGPEPAPPPPALNPYRRNVVTND